jgi:hypothetical protein
LMIFMIGVKCLMPFWKVVWIMTENRDGGLKSCWKRSKYYRKTLNELASKKLWENSK